MGEQASADSTVVAAFRDRWDLDKPLHQQYLIYLWNLGYGDTGDVDHDKAARAA